MKKMILYLVSCLMLFGIQVSAFENINKDGLALKGYDPVSYFKSAVPEKGRDKISLQLGKVKYLFSNESNKQAFAKDPKKYEPQFGGWCAYAVADSKSKVDIDPESFLIQDGRLLVFYKGFFGDTKKKWQTTKNKDVHKYLIEADSNWLEIKSKEP
jgi:YHS domain-containing protein